MVHTPMPRNRIPALSPGPVPLTSQVEVIEGPWWFKAAYMFGVPAVIAGALVWMLAVRVDGSNTTIKESQAKQEAALSQQARQLELLGSQLVRMEHLLEQICANGVPTTRDNSTCFK